MTNAVTWALGCFVVLATALHLGSIALAMSRCRKGSGKSALIAPPVTIIRPLCGLEHRLEASLESTFNLAHADRQILLCVARRTDPAAAVADNLFARYPDSNGRLLVGDERVSENPKLNNIVKGWEAAGLHWVVIADSNVLMPPDYLARLFEAWRHDTGLVCAPPVGVEPRGVGAELECASRISRLNSYQARWQYAADTVGLGFAQGKTMLWRREILDAHGGIAALGREPAEDAAATKLVRAAGLRVRLADEPSLQPLGPRRLREVWRRQSRWSQLRRVTFPHFYAAEIFSGALAPLLCLLALLHPLDGSDVLLIAAFIAAWYGAEAAVCYAAGWPLSARIVALCVVRDALLPFLWLAGWLRSTFEWRGNDMTLDAPPAAASRPLQS
jgi:ceramide glucosyltransferase